MAANRRLPCPVLGRILAGLGKVVECGVGRVRRGVSLLGRRIAWEGAVRVCE